MKFSSSNALDTLSGDPWGGAKEPISAQTCIATIARPT
jgi:hypothetical protein